MSVDSATGGGEVREFSKCYGCGKANPIGLQMRFRWEGEQALAEFTPGELHQGWPGICHGGVVSAALDEATGYVPYFQGITTVTARLSLRFRRTARLGEKLLLSAYAVKQAKRIIEVRAEARLTDGALVAECDATMFVLRDDELPEYGIQ